MNYNQSEIDEQINYDSIKELVEELIENVEKLCTSETQSKPLPEQEHLTSKMAEISLETKFNQVSNDIKEIKDQNETKDENDFYNIKWIKFDNQKVPIILQNKNGPCPLISICNVLLLKGQFKLPKNIEVISNESLIQKLADVLFNIFIPRLHEQTSNGQVSYHNYEKNIDDALSVFHKLQHGLDVNVKFSGCTDFEYTKEMDIFDLFSINLFHGWLIDPEQTDLHKYLFDKSYNQLVEISINGVDSKLTPEVDASYLKLLAEEFLRSTASQLTYYGLSVLYSTLKPNELAVLFRNNHFSTIYKHPETKCLYTLVTDFGYINHSDIVWETLENCEGDGQFCDSNFSNKNFKQSFVESEHNAKCDNDYLLALSLQEQINQETQNQHKQTSIPRSTDQINNQTRSPKQTKKDKSVIDLYVY